MNQTMEIIQSEFAQASFETFEMVLISMIAAAIFGTILGLVLHLASNPIFFKNKVVNGIAGTIINVIRSLPFIILIIILYYYHFDMSTKFQDLGIKNYHFDNNYFY